ncbi:MAG: TRAP transporter small permease subunit [Spirochaetia bacterium]|jgi:TRAP-type C4-dicarboxylate transport system permease small subunit|nr:TRAP transporter small permease subunit [Spirochaetia bacterium]
MDAKKYARLVYDFKIFLGILVLLWIILENIVIVTRYVLKISIPWSNELFILMFVWFVFIGAALESIDEKHIAITLLHDALKTSRSIYILKLVQDFLFLVFIAIVCYESWNVCLLQHHSGQITSILKLPVYISTMSLSVGSTAWAAILIQKIRLDFKGIKEGDNIHE